MPDRWTQQNILRRPGALLQQAVAVRDLVADPPDAGQGGIGLEQRGKLRHDLALGARDRIVPISAPGVKLPGISRLNVDETTGDDIREAQPVAEVCPSDREFHRGHMRFPSDVYLVRLLLELDRRKD
jgi:hypothetical protein